MRSIDADELKKCVLKWLPQDPCGKEEKEMPFETDICVSMLMEIDEQPTIQPDNGLQSLAEEITSFKRCVKSDNSDYLTGYMCALSVVEGMIANMRGKQNEID